jgi:hypothetical protein
VQRSAAACFGGVHKIATLSTTSSAPLARSPVHWFPCLPASLPVPAVDIRRGERPQHHPAAGVPCLVGARRTATVGAGGMIAMLTSKQRETLSYIRTYPRRLWLWLRRAHRVGLFLLVLVPTWAVAAYVLDTARSFTVTGLILQAVGIGLVVIGIGKRVQEHGGVSILDRIARWFGSFPQLRPHRHAIGAGMSSGWGMLKGRGRARCAPPPANATLQERVERMEADIEKMIKELDQIWGEIDREVDQLKQSLLSEASERRAEVARLDERITKSAIGDFDLELVGVAWVLAGLIISGVGGLLA